MYNAAMTHRDTGPMVHAEVVLRRTGERPLGPKGSGSSSMGPAASVPERLRSLGFQVIASSPVSISIAGPAELFRSALGVRTGEEIAVPEELSGEVEGIYIQPTPEYFGGQEQ